MHRDPLIVLKFGGSALRDRAALRPAVHEIYRWYRRGYRVLAVVSAFEGVTDRLLGEARSLCDDPAPDRTATLLATGELTTASLLGLALQRAGLPAATLTPHQVGLRVRGGHLDAEAVSTDSAAIHNALDRAPVVVVPGFIGVGEGGEYKTLGRGGSDLSALFLAAECGAARCRLIKDVPGVFDHDPRAPGPFARLLESVTYEHALQLDGGVIQHKATRFARDRGLVFEVGTLHAEFATTVGGAATTYAPEQRAGKPLRVGLLGLGTVGLGVYRQILGMPDQAQVVFAACRDFDRAIASGVPGEILRSSLVDLPLHECDVLVEAVGGLEPVGQALEQALRAGVPVVTANKAVIAARLGALREAAEAGGTSLRFAAAVGGAAPIVEGAARIAAQSPIAEIEGVLNGTVNTVLDQIRSGRAFEAALDHARRRGLAEADPSRDLNGQDAADKLAVLAEVGFGETVPTQVIERHDPVSDGNPGVPFGEHGGQVVRQVAWIRVTANGLEASVDLRHLAPDHPLAGVHGAENAAVITTRDGKSQVIRGTGAGRWPTAEAVIADVLDVRRECMSRPAGAGLSVRPITAQAAGLSASLSGA